MSNEVKMVGYKATVGEYEEIKSQSTERGISLSTFLRLAVRKLLNGTAPTLEEGLEKDRIGLEKQLERADSEIQHLREQLNERNEQIDHLTQIAGMSQKNISALSEQLDNSRQLIEDLRTPPRRKGFWGRLLLYR